MPPPSASTKTHLGSKGFMMVMMAGKMYSSQTIPEPVKRVSPRKIVWQKKQIRKNPPCTVLQHHVGNLCHRVLLIATRQVHLPDFSVF